MHPPSTTQTAADTRSRVDRRASSIDEFCIAHGISRAMFYKIRKQGRAPRIMTVGSRQLISDEAAAEWRQSMEAA
jgi:predicted DNA-binding transcriptional regulator AlpA